MRTLLFSIISLIITFSAYADLSIEGTYQGKNLYVQNPTSMDGFGFCVTKVTVNNNILPGGVNRSAFEIDFSLFDLKVGDEVFIVIEHGDGCTPKILNPEVLLPKSTFQVTDMVVQEDGTVKWTTTSERGQLPYIVEQYRWNKWVSAGEVQGTGEAGPNNYEFKVVPYSGENKIRVVQIDYSGKKRKSPVKTFVSATPKVEMAPRKVKSKIKFTTVKSGEPVKTRYEIFDAYGNIVKKGYGTSIDCKNLRKGAYYINFDNTNEKFIKT